MSEYQEYKAQLLIAEAKLAKDPENVGLLNFKQTLLDLISLECELEEDDEREKEREKEKEASKSVINTDHKQVDNDSSCTNSQISESDKKKEQDTIESQKLAKLKKKKAKSREKMKEKLELAEQEKQTWQCFANKGLKGMTKKSIFASPCGPTGKVGVGTLYIGKQRPPARK